MNIPIQLKVTVYNEHVEGPNLARIILGDELIKWIKKMNRLVKRNNVANISDYDSSPNYYVKDDFDELSIKEYEYSLDCEMIVITKSGFLWKGLIGDSISYETDSMLIKDLNKLVKFYEDTPLSEMPKYINSDDYSTREIALQRMKGE